MQNLFKIVIEIFENWKLMICCFVDSSHVSKIGSDLIQLCLRFCPILKNGVYIHFHDIRFPLIFKRID
jgi:hypothetical protein